MSLYQVLWELAQTLPGLIALVWLCINWSKKRPQQHIKYEVSTPQWENAHDLLRKLDVKDSWTTEIIDIH